MSTPTLPRTGSSHVSPTSRVHPSPTEPSPGSASAGSSTAAPPVAARFRYSVPDQGWWWSPEMFVLHGLTPTTAPSTQLLLDLQHPADRGRTRTALSAAGQDGQPFALEIRVLRPDGGLRAVVLVGEPVTDGNGPVTAVEGIVVDVTEGRRGAELDRVRELETEVAQLRTAMVSRASIEQAKGILMLLTGCGDQPAFDLLAHISSHTHRKVRDVAVAISESATGQGKLPDDIAGILRDACPPTGR